jgi:putative endonuclease
MSKAYYVYILQSVSRRVLHIGMTSDIEHRMFQHKTHAFDGFAAKYKCERLVLYERYGRVHDAIQREKQLKGWRREKKEWLITQVNPRWRDLSKEWWEELQRVWAAGDELRSVGSERETKGPSTPRDTTALRSG